MKYGIFDTQDHCWIGNDKGPKLFDEELLAQVAAQMTCAQLDWPLTRLRAKPYDGSGIQLKDEIKTKRTAVRALRLVEGGYV